MSLEKIISEYLSRKEHPRNPEANMPDKPETVGGARPSFYMLLIKGRSHSGEGSPSIIERRTDALFPENEDPRRVSWKTVVGEYSVI